MPREQDAGVEIYDNRDEDNYSQAGDLYRIMSEDQKQQLANNIADGLSQATKDVQEVMFVQYDLADSDYGERVIKAVANRQ